MKCPNCGGTGVIHFRNIHVLCGKCQGIGFIDDEPKPKKQSEKLMTEQEYIQTCTTEQLAEVLADVSLWIHPFMKQKNRFELLKKQFYEWLKQPHHEKE